MGWCDKESRSVCMAKVGLQWVYVFSVTLPEIGKQSVLQVSKIKIF